MNKFYLLLATLCILSTSHAQTPVPLQTLQGYTYTENFADINSWTFSSSGSGAFTSGAGSAPWKGMPTGGTGTIPNGSRVTTSSTVFTTMGSGGVQRGTESLVLLSTGTTDNSSSTAMDLLVDFTGLNAGTISFDWASVNNNTGNRNGSLHVYASTDGVNFTEINGAQVLNFTNNVQTAGSITNINLPAVLNNAATGRIRFYYNNGTGGTTGSRPKISLDNIKVSGVSTAPCTTPAAQPSALNFSAVTDTSIQASFMAANPASNGYLIVMSNNPSLSANPVNATTYNVGDNLGDGNVVAFTTGNTFNVTGLTPSTTYYFFVFAMNQLCSGGPNYLISNPLTGSQATLAGFQPCVAPANQPGNLVFSNVGINSIKGTFTATTADEYLVVRSTSASLNANPTDGTAYNAGDNLGGGVVVAKNASNSFIASGLSPQTTYYFFVFALNGRNCYNGPVYNTTGPLTASQATEPLPLCVTPSAQGTALNLTASNTSANGNFAATTTADSYLVLYSLSPTLSVQPQDGITYQPGNTLGNAIVVQSKAATGFIMINLTASTTYYVFVYAVNANCSNGPKYNPTSPLAGSIATTAVATLNTYFGNLHAHSSYSDGNADNLSLTPADDYAYAKNSLCMDFLGISEHNHAGAGMSLSKWQPGINQANASTTPNFLAMYGMEWGVISGGGHVLVYGVNKLLGWETNNYDIYVPRSTYTATNNGLFKTINSFSPNAFGLLAHPGFSDYNNLANSSYNILADSAIVGSAVESGPAFSNSTSYNDKPFPMAYLEYYNTMLARGYHIGPTIDHDNHNTTFGRTNISRLAVMAPTLDTLAFYQAMKANRFFATQDCDTKVSFTVNNEVMGSSFTGSSDPAITVYVTDPSSPSLIPKIKIMYGVPGTGFMPAPLDSVFGNTLSLTDFNLPNQSTAYYYADITIGSSRTITSPIWYTKNSSGPLPVRLLSFNARAQANHTVSVNWTTTAEVNNKQFELEHSIDGRTFTTNHIAAAKNTGQTNSYNWIDVSPVDGINYYRLKQVDMDGKFNYSSTVAVDFKIVSDNSFTVAPNPVKGVLTMRVNSGEKRRSALRITDLTGRTVFATQISLQKGMQNLLLDRQLAPGTYIITLQLGEDIITRKIVKL